MSTDADTFAYAGQEVFSKANAGAVDLQNQAAQAAGQATNLYGQVTKGNAAGVVALGTGIAKGMSQGAAKTAVLDAVTIAKGAVEGASLIATGGFLVGLALGETAALVWASVGIAAASVPVIGAAIGAVVAAVEVITTTFGASSPVTPEYSSLAQEVMGSTPLPLSGLPHNPNADASGILTGYPSPYPAWQIVASQRFYQVARSIGQTPSTAPAGGHGFVSAAADANTPQVAAALAEMIGGQQLAQAALARAIRWCPLWEGTAQGVAMHGATPTSSDAGVTTDPLTGVVTGAAASAFDDGGLAWGLRLIPLAYATAGMSDAEADPIALGYLHSCAWAWDNAPDAPAALPKGLAYKLGQIGAVIAKLPVGFAAVKVVPVAPAAAASSGGGGFVEWAAIGAAVIVAKKLIDKKKRARA